MAEIVECLQQVLADQREMDADPTPQMPTYALLAGRRGAPRLARTPTVLMQKFRTGDSRVAP